MLIIINCFWTKVFNPNCIKNMNKLKAYTYTGFCCVKRMFTKKLRIRRMKYNYDYDLKQFSFFILTELNGS